MSVFFLTVTLRAKYFTVSSECVFKRQRTSGVPTFGGEVRVPPAVQVKLHQESAGGRDVCWNDPTLAIAVHTDISSSAFHPGPEFTFSLFSRSTDGNIVYFQVFTLEWTLGTDMIHLCSWVNHPVWILLFIQDVLRISNQSNRDKYYKTWAWVVKSHLTGSDYF